MKSFLLTLILSAWALVGCEPEQVAPVQDTPNGLTQAEVEALQFMREEEKLAHDVYVGLYAIWPRQVFDNISQSEQRHTNAVAELLAQFNLEDPAAGNDEGVFTNPELQTMYDDLMVRGAASEQEALLVGALIEETDIQDLQQQLDEVVQHPDLIRVFSNLKAASGHHLNGFVRNLEQLGYTYTPQILDQATYDEILAQGNPGHGGQGHNGGGNGNGG